MEEEEVIPSADANADIPTECEAKSTARSKGEESSEEPASHTQLQEEMSADPGAVLVQQDVFETHVDKEENALCFKTQASPYIDHQRPSSVTEDTSIGQPVNSIEMSSSSIESGIVEQAGEEFPATAKNTNANSPAAARVVESLCIVEGLSTEPPCSAKELTDLEASSPNTTDKLEDLCMETPYVKEPKHVSEKSIDIASQTKDSLHNSIENPPIMKYSPPNKVTNNLAIEKSSEVSPIESDSTIQPDEPSDQSIHLQLSSDESQDALNNQKTLEHSEKLAKDTQRSEEVPSDLEDELLKDDDDTTDADIGLQTRENLLLDSNENSGTEMLENSEIQSSKNLPETSDTSANATAEPTKTISESITSEDAKDTAGEPMMDTSLGVTESADHLVDPVVDVRDVRNKPDTDINPEIADSTEHSVDTVAIWNTTDKLMDTTAEPVEQVTTATQPEDSIEKKEYLTVEATVNAEPMDSHAKLEHTADQSLDISANVNDTTQEPMEIDTETVDSSRVLVNITAQPIDTSAKRKEITPEPVDSTVLVKELPVDSTAMLEESSVNSTLELKESPMESTAVLEKSSPESTVALGESQVDLSAALEKSVNSPTILKESLMDSTSSLKKSSVESTEALEKSPLESTEALEESQLNLRTVLDKSPVNLPEALPVDLPATIDKSPVDSTVALEKSEVDSSAALEALPVDSTAPLEQLSSEQRDVVKNSKDSTTLPINIDSCAERSSPERIQYDKVNGDISLPAYADETQKIDLTSISNKIQQKMQLCSQAIVSSEPSLNDSPPSKTAQSKNSKRRKTVPDPEPSDDQEASGSISPSLSRTEYAQYLGLQPTIKFKCCKCGDAGFSSINKLKEHQNSCLRSSIPDLANSAATVITQPQMRITRKVYLCSSCGTYFENWNLYIHMREVHRRHVCLCCLSMFLHAEKLALHMSAKHSMSVESFRTPDEFIAAHPMSCYLTCCTCERIFSEQDNFFDHDCGDKIVSDRRGCATCGLQFAHKSDCPHSAAVKNRGTLVASPQQNKSSGSEPGPSRQQDAEERYEDIVKKNTSNNFANDVIRLPTPAVAKRNITNKSHQKPDENQNAVLSKSSGNLGKRNNQTKTKPTCLRIKLAPVSKIKPSHRKSLNISDAKPISEQDDTSDSEESEKTPQMDLNDELSMLADEDSNPSALPNGERSPCQSPEPSTNKLNESLTTETALQSADSEEKQESNSSSCEQINKCVSEEIPHSVADENDSKSDVENEDISSPEFEPSQVNNDEDADNVSHSELVDKEQSPSDSSELNMDIDKDQEESEEEEDDDEKDGWHIDENNSKHEEEDEEKESADLNDGPPSIDFQDTPEEEDELMVAGDEAPLIELHLERSPEELPIQIVLKQAVREACNYACVYCTHANRIAVNGKQLAIHLVSEHRYQLVINSERLPLNRFVELVRENMTELEKSFFNCDTYDNLNKETQSVFVKSYECFQCRYCTKVHKDLYLHNRKMHQKNSLVCIMCKTNFYSYSELLCHLCPGIYMVANQPLFRCCFCPIDNLPSAFRFMVHVRKVHQACDVCLELCGDQQKLSNHVWKHKLLHFCYRCGIAYRNKPDITKHLFWKHGTESVMCKRCLHKKWPYVYHFCIPPSLFACEECSATFSRAVALRVHKRLHTNELLYPCNLCSDSFISRKLLARHDRTIHNPPPPEEKIPEDSELPVTAEPEINVCDSAKEEQEFADISDESKNKSVTPADDSDKNAVAVSKVVDVYDLPPLNLSSDSEEDSDTDERSKTATAVTEKIPPPAENLISDTVSKDRDSPSCEMPPAVDSVWENFKDYKSSKTGGESASTAGTSIESQAQAQQSNINLLENVLFDHDYFGCPAFADSPVPEETPAVQLVEPVESASPPPPPTASEDANTSFDHNYCYNNETEKEVAEEKEEEEEITVPKKKQKSPKKKRKSGESGSSSSDSDSSSSDSSSSSCSCGTNCSCSSSSSSSSASSSSDSSDSDSSCSEKRAARKARKKERNRARKQTDEKNGDNSIVNGHVDAGSAEEPNVEDIVGPPVMYFHESDLDTNESDTDEDFYDEQPRLLMPSRNLLLLSSAADSLMSPQPTPAPTPPPAEIPSSDNYPLNNGLTQMEQVSGFSNLVSNKQTKGKKRKRSLSTPKRESKLKSHLLDTPAHRKMVSTHLPKLSVQTQAYSNFQYPESMYSPGSSDLRGGSGSETDSNVRLGKRKRVPKKFYGDSSDEESNASAPMTPSTFYMPTPVPPPPPLPPPAPAYKPIKKKAKTSSSIETEHTPSRNQTEADMKLQAVLDFVAAGYDGRTADDDNYKKTPTSRAAPYRQPKLILTLGNHSTRPEANSSSSSSGSESDDEAEEDDEIEADGPSVHKSTAVQPTASYSVQMTPQSRQVKLYCYCQCPYDEVSEMIACDGRNCNIEWFHFECVGITIPPKGKWYCPDCRKRYNIAEPAPNPEYFYNPSSEYMRSSAEPTHSYFET